MSSVLVYGDTSPNLIDGSSIWLSSITTVLAQVVDEVHLLLKFPVESDLLIGPLTRTPGVVIHEPEATPATGGPQLSAVVDQASRIVRDADIDTVLVRGLEACIAFSSREEICSRLWSYVTDLPFPPSRLSLNGQNRLNRLAHRSLRMLSQTQSSRSYLESIAPLAAGKTILMPPMIPDEAFRGGESDARDDSGNERLELIYSGKFAREWRTHEMLELPRVLRTLGVDAHLTMIGSKFNRSSADPGWVARMREALEAANDDPGSGVEWLGSMPRAESIARMGRATIGIGWRTEVLDSSLEISTKVLEYGATGAAPLLNETLDHRALYGEDYPLFASGRDTVVTLAQRIAEGLPRLAEARDVARRVSSAYSTQQAAARLRHALESSGVRPRTSPALGTEEGEVGPSISVRQEPRRILVASHDLKFMGELLESLRADPRNHVDIDSWSSLHTHDAKESARLLARAHLVLCEWAGPNLIWYSNQVRDDQRLVGRLHGFELRNGNWLERVRYDRVDALVVVSDHYRDLTTAQLPLPVDRVRVIPNMIDVDDFTRPKFPGSQFRLGLVGWVPFLKRPDRALDLLSTLIEHDDRFHLHVRGRPPWEYDYVWKKQIERQHYLDFFNRLSSDPTLRDHVVFEGFGADIASWFRKIGFALSPSDHESFHLAPAEGMASGALPIVWERLGASSVFGAEHVYEDTLAAANRIRQIVDSGAWEHESGRMMETARLRWDSRTARDKWAILLEALVPTNTDGAVEAQEPAPRVRGPLLD